MCIKEGLRLHCPVPIVGREITTDLDIGDRVIPRSTVISVNIHYRSIHYRSKYITDNPTFTPMCGSRWGGGQGVRNPMKITKI